MQLGDEELGRAVHHGLPAAGVEGDGGVCGRQCGADERHRLRHARGHEAVVMGVVVVGVVAEIAIEPGVMRMQGGQDG